MPTRTKAPAAAATPTARSGSTPAQQATQPGARNAPQAAEQADRPMAGQPMTQPGPNNAQAASQPQAQAWSDAAPAASAQNLEPADPIRGNIVGYAEFVQPRGRRSGGSGQSE